MKLEIISIKDSSNREVFEYTLCDGPEDREKVHGYSKDIIVAFTKVLEWREKINKDYQE